MHLDEIEGLERLATKDDLRLAILELKADLMKFAIVMQLSFAMLILGAVYAMLNHWRA